ncbi:MarR family winged helix-turn-helix transcriptional regulator [Sagittula sp. MA-2]|uniref:MarR family winged helix-turn-helix transcriptional regulator n=1 Tax=Sagittula sp. MA-2 TaxID=3048007 RepID=UPI0024C3737E|nr:MarR family winged helix-turn-helix transcriptional regulator [Sagittula sp. MA-2]WHZ37865.1 MarR family winged helix-turn-helix transcriptional regulator [Sagittula sp. MA-2]
MTTGPRGGRAHLPPLFHEVLPGDRTRLNSVLPDVRMDRDHASPQSRALKASEIYDQPGYLLRRTHQVATAAFSQANADVDLTAVQFAALLHIRDTPGIDATRLAEAICFDRTTIGRLEAKGLIIRREGSLDKRTKQLRITARGSDLLTKVEQRVPAISDTILAPLNAAERQELLRLLTVLERHFPGQGGGGATKDDS